MSNHIAIIDLGSNTFHLLIKGIDAMGQGFDLFSKKTHVKMAEGGLPDKKILQSAFSRAISTLKDYKSLIDELGVDTVLAYGTSAFRDAKNIKELVEAGSDILEHDIEIISGEKEAELIFSGVINAYKPNSKPYLIIDIGGGSVEFIIAQKKKILWSQSLDIGGLRLARSFHHNNPISRTEINELKGYLNHQLRRLADAIDQYNPRVVVGAAGCFETLSKMEYVNIRNATFPEFARACRIEPENFLELSNLIQKSTQEELLEIPGMADFRAELMPVSVVLIETVLKMGNFTQMWYSDYSMKEGIFFEYLKRSKKNAL